MISMTAYWQQFKECIESLQMSTEDIEYARQMSTAKNLIETGLIIEKLGLLEIQQVSEQLHEKAKLFQNEICYTTDNHEHRFYLPKITNTQSFIFAIIYYQHLLNYQNVSYQGTINWFRPKVIDGINQKKITTAIQAQALLQEIRQYCQKISLNVDELLFLKKEEESIIEYTSRLIKTFGCQVKSPKTERKAHLPPLDDITTLEKSLEKLNHKWNQLKIKADLIDQKLSAFKHAKQDYFQLNKEWKNKWFFTKAFYWFISLFIEVSEIKNLKAAHEHLTQTQNDLKQELQNHTSKSYCSKLQKQLRKLEHEQTCLKGEITLKKEIQRQKEHKPKFELLTDKKLEKDIVVTSDFKENESSYFETSSSNDYYGFFKNNLPSRYTLQAVAVGVAAIAIQNLL
ncbi:hypothetical protein [Legionella longbeachae]|uniref:hypothetical protein n=1 Tax=Legionella longbeachae TaxID=450 RepID=UPI0012469E3C|nr:hypothetical protein [Legionella longbeachae]QEY52243.1 hypothetical protein FQU71_13975 [Legionella longbeachae]